MSSSDAIVATVLTKSYAAPTTWALRGTADRIRGVADVSFRVRKGGCLAVIGRNGAGKSTLLRLLAGLAKPTSGDLSVRGRHGSLLELGAGLIDEWTGERNAQTTLALLGMSPSRVRTAMGFVAAFCELGEFLGRPVRIYSSGMRLRLAYSLVIACEPEILITDEVLSVGDESFQRKCSHHILQHLNGGGTMVLATHNLYQAERLCDAAIWLDDGRVRAQGPCLEVTKAYKASLEEADSIHGTGMIQGIARARASVLQIEGAVGEEESVEVQFGAPLRITVDFAQPTRLEIRRPNGTLVVSVAIPGHGTFEISRPHLLPGRYTVRSLGFGQRVLDEVGVKCVGQRRELGMVYLEHRWV